MHMHANECKMQMCRLHEDMYENSPGIMEAEARCRGWYGVSPNNTLPAKALFLQAQIPVRDASICETMSDQDMEESNHKAALQGPAKHLTALVAG